MSPSVEEGVNNTMVGALQLAEKVFAVLRDGSSGTMQEILEKAVKEYEEGIFVRVHGVARETLQGLGRPFTAFGIPGNDRKIQGRPSRSADAVYSRFSLLPGSTV